MSFFRRKPLIESVTARVVRPSDRARLIQLIHSAERRFLTSSLGELPGLLVSDPTTILETRDALAGLLSFGWRTTPVAWLRTLVLERDLDVADALRKLGEPAWPLLRADGITLAAITLDQWSEQWLRRPLLQVGYRPVVEVVGYEKEQMVSPTDGNPTIEIRPATLVDLNAVLALDRTCFPLPWIKGVEILEPAIRTSPCFLLACDEEDPVGYAFVTTHHGGRLVHLVRIAVMPEARGRAIGARLLAEIVAFAARSHAEVLTLNTQQDNLPAQRLYEWFGFRRTGEHQTVLGLEIGG